MKSKNRIISLMILNSLLFVASFALFACTAEVESISNLSLAGLFLVIILSMIFTRIFVKQNNALFLHIDEVLKNVVEGDVKARIDIENDDEPGDISGSINKILDDHMVAITAIENKNETLNNSILKLLETVTQLAKKNLTVTAVVSEDLTGPIADALNIMSSETSRVLTEVINISEEISETSNFVKAQSDDVILLAENEMNIVKAIVTELASTSDIMAKINKLAEHSNTAADNASKSTKAARNTVTNTITGINKIRDIIRETEKRIERLGEYSQEINSAVNLVNDISERTHILALNAGMHAASAGGAGRNFSVMADEVQRLAESSREASSEIKTIINNIQLETAGIVDIINELNGQTVEGNRLATQADNEIHATQTTTDYIVDMIQKIVQGTSMQNRHAGKLCERVDIVRNNINTTADYLREQTVHITRLAQQALSLVNAVSGFTLKEVHAKIIDEENPGITLNPRMNIDAGAGRTVTNSMANEKTVTLDMDMDIKLIE